MTATDKLRELLDERGVEWEGTGEITFWADCSCCAFDGNNEKVTVHFRCTPEQAIAATLGCRELTAEQVRKCAKEVYFEGYNDGSVGRGPHIEETDWQWIANKLNAGLEKKTCHNTQTDFDFQCSECGTCLDNGRTLGIRYCPHCGAKVMN